jgi:hypothetical protein
MEKPTLEISISQLYNRVGLGSSAHNSNIPKYLELSKEDLEKLSPTDCAEISYLLHRESIYIQKILNTNTATINRLNKKIDYLTINKLEKYNIYLKYEQKRLLAIKDSPELIELYTEVINRQTQNDAIMYIPNLLKNMAESLIEISRNKRGAQK